MHSILLYGVPLCDIVDIVWYCVTPNPYGVGGWELVKPAPTISEGYGMFLVSQEKTE